MATPHVSADTLSLDELELRAEEQRQRLGRDVANLRYDVANLRQTVREQMNVRGRLEDGIHAKPGGFYAAAAVVGLIAGLKVAKSLR
jgi:ElaB/YqjD/DUF883 family membrane-anchored ribosome-binding protein